MKEEKKEIVKKDNVVETRVATPAEMIKLAVTGGADLDKLEKLLTLQERWEANEAKKAYNQAMSNFKANSPKINKDKKVAYKEVRYNHASLANVTEKINSELSKHGLSASWLTKQNGVIIVTCKITHIKGHSEETTLSASADATGSKNAIQAIGSTITYLERYTLLALTGLATFEDDDGKSGGVEHITQEQGNKILDMIADTKTDIDKFLAYMKVDKLEEIAKGDYKKAIVALENKKKAGK